MATLSRPKAVRDKCYDCSGFDRNEVRACAHKECALYPFRTARAVRDDKKKGDSRVKAVFQYCLDCSGGSITEREKCVSAKCPLYPYRNPKAVKETNLHT